MKKILCLVLALVLCMMAGSAMAESVPSKTTSDLMHFEVTAENQPGDDSLFLRPVEEIETEEYQVRLAISEKEIDKLKNSESIDAYFGNVLYVDVAGNETRLTTVAELMETDKLNVFEFWPLIAGGFNEDPGKVQTTMLFSTPYEEGERVLVLIGLVTLYDEDGKPIEVADQTEEETQIEGEAQTEEEPQIEGEVMTLEEAMKILEGRTQTVEWRAYEGIGLEPDEDNVEFTGRIAVELDPETVLAIQDGTALLAIVSIEEPETEAATAE